MRESVRELEREQEVQTHQGSVPDLAQATFTPETSVGPGVVQETLRLIEETSDIPIEYLKENGLWDAWRAAAERAVDLVPASADPQADIAELIKETASQFREEMGRKA